MQVGHSFSWPSSHTYLYYENTFISEIPFLFLLSLSVLNTYTITNTRTHTLPLSSSLSSLSCLLVPGLASLSLHSRASVLEHLCFLSCQLTWPSTPCQLIQTLGYVCVCMPECMCVYLDPETQTNREVFATCVPDITSNLQREKMAHRNLLITVIYSFMIIFTVALTEAIICWQHKRQVSEGEWVKPHVLSSPF